MSSPSSSESWHKLFQHYEQLKSRDQRIDALFAADPERFQHFSLQICEILLDYSKNLVTEDTLNLLFKLAREAKLEAAIKAMFRGDNINNTEGREALHIALRTHLPDADPQFNAQVNATLEKIKGFVARVHSGQWTGCTGKSIKSVVNIGIGGSDLGPAMVTEALRHKHVDQLQCYFVSNVDPVHMKQTLASLDPETTLFIVASKSFSTLETHQNAAYARRWFLSHCSDESQVAKHFVAVSANVAKAEEFGIDPSNIFPLWDWVGGRYSLWSAIGLPIALAVGMAEFEQLLSGARTIDEHFANTPLEENIPVIMGLLAIWNCNFLGASSQAILPYSQALHLFPAFLQQLEMESLGKSVKADGSPVTMATGPIVWGSSGTNGQHSFHQLLHQGTHLVPADFIAIVEPQDAHDAEQHKHLLANCFSQSQALMTGKSAAEAAAELEAQGVSSAQASKLAQHKKIPGNKPSTTLIMQQLSAKNLGSLIAIYEHKVFVESVLWGINAFDQWGVELGKQLGVKLFDALDNESATTEYDASTNGLINHCK
ncbi:MAG: glucose-6-phosphate isomerase [Pseudohongiellaceae bacterium]|nr:glucose-6-phosphate isomerase [Pseudohongiellaceae bacterium]